MDQKHTIEGHAPQKNETRNQNQTSNPLQLLKWVEGATPKKKQANHFTLKQLEEQKHRRQAFLALYPHRHIPTRAETEARKRKKDELTYVSPWDSRIQKLFHPIEWYNRMLDSKILDAGVEFAKQFGFERGSIQWKWNSWRKSGRTDLMPIGGQKFYNGLYILTRDDFHFQALGKFLGCNSLGPVYFHLNVWLILSQIHLHCVASILFMFGIDSQGILRTCGLVKKEDEAEFEDQVTSHSRQVGTIDSRGDELFGIGQCSTLSAVFLLCLLLS